LCNDNMLYIWELSNKFDLNHQHAFLINGLAYNKELKFSPKLCMESTS